jgi:peptidoglycan/LPS O-acetylase OafA/YrhL
MTAWILATVAGRLAVLALAERPHGVPAKLLALPLVVYVGTRSYALYLWHYVWLTWFRSFGVAGTLMALATSFACAELSWRLVETRAGALSRRPMLLKLGSRGRSPVRSSAIG